MPRRSLWWVAGVAMGAGSSLWAERRLRRSVAEAAARLQPDALVVEVGRTAREAAGAAGDRVRDAVSAGREAMHRREEELWVELAARGAAPEPVVEPAAEPGAQRHAPRWRPQPRGRRPGRRRTTAGGTTG